MSRVTLSNEEIQGDNVSSHQVLVSISMHSNLDGPAIQLS